LPRLGGLLPRLRLGRLWWLLARLCLPRLGGLCLPRLGLFGLRTACLLWLCILTGLVGLWLFVLTGWGLTGLVLARRPILRGWLGIWSVL
jgi:hypothetical protein